MEKIKIDEGGRKTLTNLLLSCVLMPTKLSGKQVAVSKMSSCQNSLVELSSFQVESNSPDNLPILDCLQKVARLQNKSIIDKEFLWEFFSGTDHYADVLRDVAMVPIISRQLWTIAHMLLPVIVDNKGEEFLNVTYKNGENIVHLKNVYMPEHFQAKIGDTVLIHYATVVDTTCPIAFVNKMLNTQSEFKEFIEAIKSIDKIDFKRFFMGDLTQRTKDIFVKD